jgi:hypothetical protein
MNRQTKRRVSFESEHRAFAYIFAGCVTVATFPVVGWHYAVTLTGLAVAAIGGLVITDVVLWFAAHWSVKTKSAAMRAVSLIVKFALASVMVINAGVVIYLMRGDRQTENAVKLQTDARASEIKARADAAKELAKERYGSRAAREAMKMDEARSAQAIAADERAKMETNIPAWYLDIGIYITPPIAAILAFMMLSVTATIIKRREDDEEREDERQEERAPSAPSLPEPARAEPMPDRQRQVYVNGVDRSGKSH